MTWVTSVLARIPDGHAPTPPARATVNAPADRTVVDSFKTMARVVIGSRLWPTGMLLTFRPRAIPMAAWLEPLRRRSAHPSLEARRSTTARSREALLHAAVAHGEEDRRTGVFVTCSIRATNSPALFDAGGPAVGERFKIDGVQMRAEVLISDLDGWSPEALE